MRCTCTCFFFSVLDQKVHFAPGTYYDNITHNFVSFRFSSGATVWARLICISTEKKRKKNTIYWKTEITTILQKERKKENTNDTLLIVHEL